MNFKIVVIGIEGQLRSNSLEKWLKNISNQCQIIYIPPYRPGHREVQKYNQTSTFHFGAPLKNGEVGCSLAHYKAQRVSLESSNLATFFFEDDAEIIDLSLEYLESVTKLIHSRGAAGISIFNGHYKDERHFALFDEPFEAFGSSFRQFRRGAHPYGTVAYGLSESALQMAARSVSWISGLPIGKADFPSWASGLNWFLSQGQRVGHLEGPSMIDNRVDAPLGLGRIGQTLLLGSRLLSLMSAGHRGSLLVAIAWEFWEFWYRVRSGGKPIRE